MTDIDKYFWVSERTKHALRKAGAWNIESVFSLSKARLLEIKGIGPKGANEIIDERHNLGAARYNCDSARRHVEKAKHDIAPLMKKLEMAKKQLKESEDALSALADARARLGA